MTNDFTGSIPARVFDDYVDTSITVSCYRETHRLDRMLAVFHKCLTLVADQFGDDRATLNFRGAIRKLHDSKGRLVVTWRSPSDFYNYQNLVELAWRDCGEHEIYHEDRDGRELRMKLGDAEVHGMRPVSPQLRVLRAEASSYDSDNWDSIGDAASRILGRVKIG